MANFQLTVVFIHVISLLIVMVAAYTSKNNKERKTGLLQGGHGWLIEVAT